MAAPDAREYIRQLEVRINAEEPVVVATVVAIRGSASARPGAKAIVDARGRTVFGWVGGGCVETAVRDEAMRAMQDGRPRMMEVDLDDEVLGVGMPCGGSMQVYVEPLMPQPRLLVLGHGVIAESLCRLAHALEFRVVVNDPLATPDRFPDAEERITEDPDYAKIEGDSRTYVVIATQHRGDLEALHAVLAQSPAYVGLIASRKRSGLILDRLREDGVAESTLGTISAPCGLDLGAETPQEIALSILSEILLHRRGHTGTGGLLRDGGAEAGEDVEAVPDDGSGRGRA